MSKVKNVTAAKPKIGGAIYSAKIGTALPSDASTKLDDAFVALGYCSEDGLTNENSPETETVKAWGGDIVLTPQTEKSDTFKFKLLETLDVNVLKEVYGQDNVSGTLDTGIIVKANSNQLEDRSYVIELIMRGNALKRIVIPQASISEISEITYSDSDPVGYEITLTAMPDSESNTHYEYIISKGTE